jgi:hypothetical protein
MEFLLGMKAAGGVNLTKDVQLELSLGTSVDVTVNGFMAWTGQVQRLSFTFVTK